MEGFDLDFIKMNFGIHYYQHTISTIESMRPKNYLIQDQNKFMLSKAAKFLADGIASDFFILDAAQWS